MTSTVIILASDRIINWHYLWWVVAALVGMLASIFLNNLWLLNFVHVLSSLLWTGIDLFMGFVLGPVLRKLSLSQRRDIAKGLTPRTLFIMPTLSIISGTTGWFLADALGYTALPWPQFTWVVLALGLVALMTAMGLGFLLPVNVSVCFELQKEAPDLAKIGRRMRLYFYGNAAQGLMQIATIVIMTRFRVGL